MNDASKSGTPGPLSGTLMPRDTPPASSPLADGTTAAVSGDKTVETQNSFEERLLAVFNRSKGPIDWSAVRIQNDLPSASVTDDSSRGEYSVSENENWLALSESETKKYLDLYFTHFHHRWPIIHAPTFESENVPPVLLSCMTMIGACIHGTSESKEIAMNFHTRVIDWIFPRLVGPFFLT